MILIKDRIFIDVLIDGNPVPEAFNLISTIALTEGNNALFPACSIVFNDMSGYLKDQLNLVDGNSISITVGKQHDDVSTVTRQYRLFGSKAPATPAGALLKVVGIYDAPNFTTASVSEAFKGTTSQVMQEIANICKLTYDGPKVKTNDDQIWYNISKTRSTFVQEVARRGIIDQHSAMNVVLTSLGELKYKNWMELIEDQPTFTLFHNVPPGGIRGQAYLVKQARDSSSAGMVNSWQNYGSQRICHSLTGSQVIEDTLEVKTSGNYLPVNKQVADTVQKSRQEYTILDCSNTHAKYERAYYQNQRLSALFCERESVLITECTDIQLFDTVYYRQADSDITKAAEPSDIYLVIGKTVYVKGSQSYGERLELIRMSVTNKGAAPLATQNPTSLRSNVIPESYVNPTINFANSTAGLVSTVTKIFSALNNPTQIAHALLGQVGNFAGASSLQLGTLIGLVSGQGISNVADKALNSLKLVNGPSSYLASSVSSLNSTYLNLDNLLGAALTQIEGLSPSQQQQVYKAGLVQASLFNPSGVITSLATVLPLLQNLSQISSVYSSVQHHINSNAYYLNQLDPDAQQHVDQFNTHANSLASNYAGICTSTNNLWNKCISIANNKPIPNDLYNYTQHTEVLNQLAEQSLQVPSGNRNKVTTLATTSKAIGKVLQATDNNRQLYWMYPASPINRTYRYRAEDLPVALDTMNQDISMIPNIITENPIG